MRHNLASQELMRHSLESQGLVPTGARYFESLLLERRLNKRAGGPTRRPLQLQLPSVFYGLAFQLVAGSCATTLSQELMHHDLESQVTSGRISTNRIPGSDELP